MPYSRAHFDQSAATGREKLNEQIARKKTYAQEFDWDDVIARFKKTLQEVYGDDPPDK